jgi:hypothetical protein
MAASPLTVGGDFVLRPILLRKIVAQEVCVHGVNRLLLLICGQC